MREAIHVERTIAASPEKIWRALTRCEEMARWQADAVSGGLEEGGFALSWPSLGARLELDVVEARENDRLLVRNGAASVEVRIVDDRVHLWHRGLAPDDDHEGLAGSWNVALSLLGHYLERHPGRDRAVSWALRPMRTRADVAHVFFTDQTALGSWLTRGDGGIGAEGEQFDCTSQWGSPLGGAVLARHVGRDVAVTWREQDDSALVFRTLPSPLSHTDRLVAVAWSHWGGHVSSKVSDEIASALGRLKLVLESGAGA